MSHECPRNGCTRTVGDQWLMCPADWRRVPAHLQRAVYAAYDSRRGLGTEALAAAQDAAIRAVNGEPGPPPRPGPAELWEQSGGNRDLYLDLLREHGHLLGPGDEGYDQAAAWVPPCGWRPRGNSGEG